jgi:hypothetical protein
MSSIVILSADFMILRLTTGHENVLSPLGQRVARDGAFTSRRESGEGVWVCYFHGSEESQQLLLEWTLLSQCPASSGKIARWK